MVLKEEQSGPLPLDEALENLTGTLDAPLFALLSIATACEEAIEEIKSRAIAECSDLFSAEPIVSQWAQCRVLLQRISEVERAPASVVSEGSAGF
mmetsp:Transcript_558/g.1087  ORF Transcript_558/g.1087 Transcript_558/m.1087 type:complete len:95 (-) Transcript_558:11-295(-)